MKKVSARKKTALLSAGKSVYHKPDYILFGVIQILIFFGIVMIFDASVVFANDQFGDKFYFVKQSIIGAGIGIAVATFLYNFDYHILRQLVLPIVGGTILLLLAVFLPGIGVSANGAHRWINLGVTVLQPSEVAKLSFIIYLSAWLSKLREVHTAKNTLEGFREHIKKELLPFLLVLGVICALVIAEPDLGSTLVIAATAFAVYFISGTDLIHTLGSGLIMVVMGFLAGFAAILSPYRLQRIKTFIPLLLTGTVENSDAEGYQILQILIAVGSGGLFGVGFGESKQKFMYLVETTAVTDSIFAVIAEELGLVGSIFLIALFCIFLYRGYLVAKNAPDKFGGLLASGCTFWLGIQAFFNIAANLAIIPLTGIPLPFISYGSSALVMNLAAIGILLNISRQTVSSSS